MLNRGLHMLGAHTPTLSLLHWFPRFIIRCMRHLPGGCTSNCVFQVLARYICDVTYVAPMTSSEGSQRHLDLRSPWTSKSIWPLGGPSSLLHTSDSGQSMGMLQTWLVSQHREDEQHVYHSVSNGDCTSEGCAN